MNSFLAQEVPVSWYLLLSAALFSLGVVGFLIKRNLITVFMSIELMLNAVNLSFVTFAHQWHAVKGQIFVFFVMMVAAAEAAVGSGDHHCSFPRPRYPGRRPYRPDETMNVPLHLWLIPLLPFAGFLINGLLGRRIAEVAGDYGRACLRRWLRSAWC